MFTFGLKSATGTGGGDTYLQGGLDVDMLLQEQLTNMEVEEVELSIGMEDFNVDAVIEEIDIAPTVETVDVNAEIEEADIDMIIEIGGVENGC